MKKAFTLIELLVVIAIIAILAAILFPVFAQAKLAAKKTAAIAQCKQTGTAINIYLSDSDDLMPLGSTPNLTVTTGYAYYNTWPALHPAGWAPDSAAQNTKAEDELVWANSISPYIKNNDMYLTQGLTGQTITTAPWAAWYAAPKMPPRGGNLTYNGVLQYLSASEVASPSMLPLLWQGMGDTYWTGRIQTSPRLICNSGNGNICRYSTNTMPQGQAGTGFATQMSIYATKTGLFTGSNIFVSVDSSAKAVRFAGGNKAAFPQTCNNRNPIRDVDSNGNVVFPTQTQGWQYSSGIAIHCAFDPQNAFDN